ncbi:glycosyltransferase family 87 protein [Tengunoibacter tsumagoiensis]|uniref:DUF2029 domain-containing protein n=1 Tax=Tengunoibacter tsumagoiensis TaxID=2014871 RepID=A0A402A807_9CHLR|nr:glycosyltransferase family 87 protein [Tengunoibacter tsumagoiensis]GCE15218.1 hypothetical protein KTT_50770 [Tengunoibacter tsumagoiensis]
MTQSITAPYRETPPSSYRHPWRTSAILGLLLLLSLGCASVLARIAHPGDTKDGLFLGLWLVSFLPYLAACLLIVRTGPAVGKWRWVEWGCLIAGALLLRVIFIPIDPNLSRDSWRYVWDARITLHGYSPLATTPNNPIFVQWQDVIYQNSRYRNVPSLYPPTAQGIYVLSYLLFPSNLYGLKGIFMLFDLGSCVLLALLLRRQGLDPRRVIFYAWCPLPIVEFAMQGHVDVTTITFMLLVFWFDPIQKPWGRILTGFFIAMATMTKFYPLLLLIVVWRPRDWALLASCFGSIVLGYIPFLVLGHGQVVGFFSHYASEQGGNAGPIQLTSYLLGLLFLRRNMPWILSLQTLINLAVVSAAVVIVCIQRMRGKISKEGACLVLIVSVFACSSHVFPWYVAALVPWLPFGIGSLWAQRSDQQKRPLHTRSIAYACGWYFACISVIGYFCVTPNQWYAYDLVTYGVVCIGLGFILWYERESIAETVKNWSSLRDKR